MGSSSTIAILITIASSRRWSPTRVDGIRILASPKHEISLVLAIPSRRPRFRLRLIV